MSRITGPHHNLLQVRLAAGIQEVPPVVECLPALAGGAHEPLSEAEVVSQVLAGVAQANAGLGGRFCVTHIRYVADDTRSESVYAVMASGMVEQLVSAHRAKICSMLADGSSCDHWSDLWEWEHAQPMLLGLQPEEWLVLEAVWPGLTLELQERLASLLGNGVAMRNAALLLQMGLTADLDIELTARESLREMPFDAVRDAVALAIDYGQLPLAALNHCASVNQLLDFVRSQRSGYTIAVRPPAV